jgi:hypothetical protein
MAIQENERKLAELILYVSQKSVNDIYFGQTKLHKILFFSDFVAFGQWGELITGAQYQHLEHGPGLYRMIPVLDALAAENAIAYQPMNCFGYRQVRVVNLREPDLTDFKGREIALVDAWIDRLKHMSATEASKFSHETAAWRATDEREIIDPRMVFFSWGDPSDTEIARGKELAEQYGLVAA